MSIQPSTDLWLERAHFGGTILAVLSYGAFFVLTVQALFAIFPKPKRKTSRRVRRFTRGRLAMLAYLISTLTLATVGVAVNVKYSQIIWIDSRGRQTPEYMISNGLAFWENVTALACYYIMSWILDLLLIYRCFIIWNRSIYVAAFMSCMMLANIIMAILTLAVSAKGIWFPNINFQLGYLIVSVSTTLIYTTLVVGRLLLFRAQIVSVFGKKHASFYVSVAAMIIESAAPYAVIGMLYVITFALHSKAIHLIFLCITHAQGIAQLPIIIRVAQGKAVETDLPLKYISEMDIDLTEAIGANQVAVAVSESSEPTASSGVVNIFEKPSVNTVIHCEMR